MASIYTQGPVEGVVPNLAVLIAVANADVMTGKPRRSVTDNARRALCEALGIQRLDETDREIARKLYAALSRDPAVVGS
jgi:hypothetical protein